MLAAVCSPWVGLQLLAGDSVMAKLWQVRSAASVYGAAKRADPRKLCRRAKCTALRPFGFDTFDGVAPPRSSLFLLEARSGLGGSAAGRAHQGIAIPPLMCSVWPVT
jgi:hypothetical protein